VQQGLVDFYTSRDFEAKFAERLRHLTASRRAGMHDENARCAHIIRELLRRVGVSNDVLHGRAGLLHGALCRLFAKARLLGAGFDLGGGDAILLRFGACLG